MNCQELIRIVREFPEGAEVFIDIDGELAPLTAGHVQVVDDQVVLTAPIEEPKAKGKRKAA